MTIPTESGTPRSELSDETLADFVRNRVPGWNTYTELLWLRRQLAEKQAEVDRLNQQFTVAKENERLAEENLEAAEAALTAERQRSEGLKRNLQNMLDLIDANTDVADWDEADEDAVLSARAALAARQP